MNSLVDHLKHIRLIHFLLVLISFTALYFVLSVWSDDPEVVKELETLKVYTEKLRSDFVNVADLITDEKKNCELNAVLNLIEKALEHKIQLDKELRREFAKQSFQLLPMDNTWPDPNSTKLKDWREALKRKEWHIQKLSQISVSPQVMTEITEWINSNTKLKAQGDGVWGGEGPFLIGMEVKWNSNADKQSNAKSHMYLQIKNFYTSADLQTGSFLTELTPTNRKFPFSFEQMTETGIRLPDRWFQSMYPHLSVKWERLENRTLTENLETTRDKIAESLEGKDLDMPLIGSKIYGPDLGYVSPIAIFLTLIYMLAHTSYISSNHLHQLTSRSDSKDLLLSPWIGAMPGVLRRLFTWSTLGFLPALAVGMALWRVLLLYIWAWLLAIIAGAIGSYCTYIGWRISKDIEPR